MILHDVKILESGCLFLTSMYDNQIGYLSNNMWLSEFGKYMGKPHSIHKQKYEYLN